MSKRRSNKKKTGTKVYPNLRRAIWLTHGKKCAYTGADLTEDAFVIDHVVPQELGQPGRADERLNVLRRLGLPDDFDLHALTNLVPTTIKLNREKSDKILPGLIAKGLALAAEKAEAVRELCDRLDAVERIEEASRTLGEKYRDRLDERLIAETTYTSILRDPARFEPIEEMAEEFAVVATHRVYSTCYAPTFPDYAGSLLLRFKRVEVYGCGITFGHRDLVGLFRGMGTPPDARSRGFVVARDERNDEYLIQLGNNRFTLSAEEAADLCGVIDRLGAWYLAKARRAECEVLNSIEFAPAEGGGYLLCAVGLGLWRKIIRFAAAHDYANGKTRWHVFDANPHYLKIFCRSEGDGRYGYRAFVRPEMDRDLPLVGGPRVWLRWDPTFFRALHARESSFKFGTLWDVAATHRWITDELIPEAVRWSHADEMWELSLTGRLIHRFLVGDARPTVPPRPEKSNGMELIDAGRVRRLTEFELVIEKLWSRSGELQESVPTAAGDGPHQFLSFLLGNCDPISNYLLDRTARAFDSTPTAADLKVAIDQRRQDYLAKGAVSGWEVKSALDAVTLLLREGNLQCSGERAIAAGLGQMAGLIEYYNTRAYIDRIAGRR